MNTSKSNHSVFYKQSAIGVMLLVIYVDDIIVVGSDTMEISSLFFHSSYHTKNLGALKYFLGELR